MIYLTTKLTSQMSTFATPGSQFPNPASLGSLPELFKFLSDLWHLNPAEAEARVLWLELISLDIVITHPQNPKLKQVVCKCH